jgi:hypothetical protein
MDKKFLHCLSCQDKKWHDKILGLNYKCRECEKITHLSIIKNFEKKFKDSLKKEKGKEIEKVKKEKREVDEDYLFFIRNLPCLVSNEECFGIVHAHHHDRKSQLGSDYSAVPLCHKHHIGGVHLMGVESFSRRYLIDFEAQIKRLLILYKLKSPKKEIINN